MAFANVSFTDEQFFWGNEFNRLGLTPKSLKKINDLLPKPGMKAKAREVGARIKNENGVKEAADIICKTFDK